MNENNIQKQVDTKQADREQNVLLQIENVKMHFPLKKEKFFQKERPYVKAVDGVTIDIYEGETFGLVGESGCGKSTLGRLLLQLYNQTEGSVRYRGITLNEYAPKYAFKDVKKIPNVKKINDSVAAAEELIKQYPEQVRIAGGKLLAENLAGLAYDLRYNLLAVWAVNKTETAIGLHSIKRDALHSSENLTASEQKRLKSTEKMLIVLKKNLERNIETCVHFNNEISKYDEECRNKPGYELLESAKDISIDLSRLTKEEMRKQRRHMQVIFQDPYSSLNSRFTVGSIISEALVTHKMYGRGTRQLEEYTLDIMDKCGLQKYFLHRFPHQFSGGQRQRICIARALALNPRFVVCDECVSALDVSIQSQIINLLMDLKDAQNLTYLFISHDLSTVKFISDRVAVMYLGNIVELGDSESLYEEPLHPYTKVLLEAIPTTEEASNKELQIIEGDVPSPINPPPGCKFHTRCSCAKEICSSEVPEWRELRPRHWVACHFPIEGSS